MAEGHGTMSWSVAGQNSARKVGSKRLKDISGYSLNISAKLYCGREKKKKNKLVPMILTKFNRYS